MNTEAKHVFGNIRIEYSSLSQSVKSLRCSFRFLTDNKTAFCERKLAYDIEIFSLEK